MWQKLHPGGWNQERLLTGLAFEPGLWARQVLSRSVQSLWNDGAEAGAMRVKKQRKKVQGLVRHAS